MNSLKMVKYIECYLEYQKLEEFLVYIVRILNLSFKPWIFLQGYEKLIVQSYNIYSLISAIFTLVYFEQNLMEILLRVIVIAGFLNVLIGSLSIAFQPNKLKILLQFIEEIHRVHEFDLVMDFVQIYLKHLKESFSIIKIILG